MQQRGDIVMGHWHVDSHSVVSEDVCHNRIFFFKNWDRSIPFLANKCKTNTIPILKHQMRISIN
jgi:hypothetical protein